MQAVFGSTCIFHNISVKVVRQYDTHSISSLGRYRVWLRLIVPKAGVIHILVDLTPSWRHSKTPKRTWRSRWIVIRGFANVRRGFSARDARQIGSLTFPSNPLLFKKRVPWSLIKARMIPRRRRRNAPRWTRRQTTMRLTATMPLSLSRNLSKSRAWWMKWWVSCCLTLSYCAYLIAFHAVVWLNWFTPLLCHVRTVHLKSWCLQRCKPSFKFTDFNTRFERVQL